MRNSKPTHREKKDPQSIRSGPFLRLGTETMLRHATNSATTSCGHSGVVSIGKVDADLLRLSFCASCNSSTALRPSIASCIARHHRNTSEV
jgi:hypothetical protein